MSAATKLGLRQSQLSEIRVQQNENIQSTTNTCNSIVKDHQDSIQLKINEEDDEDKENEDPRCTTPKSDENKIPVIINCPPAPIKLNNRVILCKRKLSEFNFFETQDGGRHQIESFFGSIEIDQPPSKIKKRNWSSKL